MNTLQLLEAALQRIEKLEMQNAILDAKVSTMNNFMRVFDSGMPQKMWSPTEHELTYTIKKHVELMRKEEKEMPQKDIAFAPVSNIGLK